MSTANKLLRQYYGLDTPDKTQEARDIDSPNFDAKGFFNEAAKNDSLPQILARENSLVTDIRAFDNDLQTLVYDNYSKFLSASDTVHSLSENISNLTSQMDHLKQNLNDISSHSKKIVDDLEPNRQRIQRLIGISRLLGRVEFISKLPNQLNACLRTEKYEAAVNVWTKVETILSTQQHFPSFKQIHEDCTKIMNDIQSRIRGQMLNADLSVEDAITCAVLLVKLKNPLGYVCNQLEHHRYLIIDNNLEYEEIPEEPFEALARLKELAIDDAETFIRLYKEKLIPLESNEENLSKVNSVLTEFMTSVFDRISKLLPAKVLFNLDCNKIVSYLNLFEKMMTSIATPQQISRHVHTLLQQFTESKTLAVFDEFKQIITSNGKNIPIKSVIQIANNDQEQTKENENDNDTNQEQEQQKNNNKELSSEELFHAATTRFSQSCSNLIDEFQVLVMMNHNECSDFLINQISQMFKKLFHFFTECDPQKSLILSMIALIFSEKEIPRIFEQLSRLESSSPLSNIQDKLSLDCKQVAKQCLSRYVTTRRLIANKLIIRGMKSINWTCKDRRQLEKDKQQNQDNQEDYSLPICATKMVLDFIDNIDRLSFEISNLLNLAKSMKEPNSQTAGMIQSISMQPFLNRDNSSNFGSQIPSSRSRPVMHSNSSFYSNSSKPTFYGIREEGIHQIDRLFTSVNRLHLSQELEFDVTSILGAIIMYTLKSALETVRKNVFSCFGFNQMQVNGFFLYYVFVDKINQQELFSALIEEIISSAADRTIDPVPLETPALQRIYDEYERSHMSILQSDNLSSNVDY